MTTEEDLNPKSVTRMDACIFLYEEGKCILRISHPDTGGFRFFRGKLSGDLAGLDESECKDLDEMLLPVAEKHLVADPLAVLLAVLRDHAGEEDADTMH